MIASRLYQTLVIRVWYNEESQPITAIINAGSAYAIEHIPSISNILMVNSAKFRVLFIRNFFIGIESMYIERVIV
jgi:hypothetical protein